MKRYALLSGATYYPSPGFTALTGFYDSVEEAVPVGVKDAGESYGWYQIVDMHTGKIVGGEGRGHSGLFGVVAANPS